MKYEFRVFTSVGPKYRSTFGGPFFDNLHPPPPRIYIYSIQVLFVHSDVINNILHEMKKEIIFQTQPIADNRPKTSNSSKSCHWKKCKISTNTVTNILGIHCITIFFIYLFFHVSQYSEAEYQFQLKIINNNT